MAHPMMVKALAGLHAAEMLAKEDHLYDDATSRLYYALYHACWAFLQTRTMPVAFDSRPGYEGTEPGSYDHRLLEEKLERHQAFRDTVGGQWRRLLGRAKRYRVIADYRPECVGAHRFDSLMNELPEAVQGLRTLLSEN